MATAWSRLAFSEEFASPAHERIDPASEPIPAANAAPSPEMLSEAELHNVEKYDHTSRSEHRKNIRFLASAGTAIPAVTDTLP
jgi:hypothetical protein